MKRQTELNDFKRGTTIVSVLCSIALLTGCGNVTGLMNASSNFGCPVAGGVNCSTLSQTYEREEAKEKDNETVKAVYEGESLPQREVKIQSIRQPKDALEKEGAIVETTTVRRYPLNASDSHGVDSTHENASHVIQRKVSARTSGVKKFNETARDLKPKRFQTTAGTLDRARKHERVVMLWVLPWVDDQGDLHEVSRIWMRIEDAGWKIESVRSRAFEAGLSGVVP